MEKKFANQEASFKKKHYYFLDRPQSIPNEIVFNIELSESALRLLLCLNAFPESWVARRSDICRRLKWGKEKMLNAVKNCCELGYMKVTQEKDEHGKFLCNMYEFDLYKSYSHDYMDDPQLKEFLPKAGDQVADDEVPDNPPLTSIKEKEPCSLEKQQTGDVVVLHEKEKREIFGRYDLSDHTVNILLQFDLDRIVDAIEAYEQWMEKNSKPDSSDAMILSLVRKSAKKNNNKMESNISFLLSIKHLDGKIINNIPISVGMDYICFGNLKTFSLKDKNFIKDVEQYIADLNKNDKRKK